YKKKIGSKDHFAGATLYTTLEPCTTRNHDKMPCAQWITTRRIKRVVIGMLDPNPTICGRGYWYLLSNNVLVEFVDSELLEDILNLNKSFVSHFRSPRIHGGHFSQFVREHKNALSRPFFGLGWGSVIS